MVKFTKSTGSLFQVKMPMMPELKNSLASLVSLFGNNGELSKTEYTVLALVKSILSVDGTIPPNRLDMFRQLSEETYGVTAAQKKLHQLFEIQALDPIMSACAELSKLESSEKENIFCFLINLSVAADNSMAAELKELAIAIGIQEYVFNAIYEKSVVDFKRRTRILKSGAGLLVAVTVIGVFILTATLLRSVIFGLIIAYLLLPIEKFIEKRLASKKGFLFNLSRTLEILGSPLAKLSAKLTRKGDTVSANNAHKDDKSAIKKAVGFTVFIAIVSILAITIGLTSMTGKYVTRISTSVKNWKNSNGQTTAVLPAKNNESNETQSIQSTAQTMQNIPGDTYDAISRNLELLRKKFEKLPLVSGAINYIEQVLKTPETRNELIKYIAKKTGGVVSFATGIAGTIVAFLCDMLLTAFFALLFLIKFAEINNHESAGSYIVKSIFNGKWLPRSSGETLEEAQRIIDGTFNRLKIWIRGYLTLVCVDASVYTTLFYFLKVPYFPLLGILAGCGIMLPYIGPILSCGTTILVTLAVGGCTGTQLVGIIICYLVYNGIVEQFILYPAVIGESLGLTTLETIIVVLLGAIFAGIPGMILALPAASVVKYLVPRIYNCWTPGNR